MRAIAAGVGAVLLLMFLITDSNADPGYGNGYRQWHCVKDFWGNCDAGKKHWRPGNWRRNNDNYDNNNNNNNNYHNNREVIGGIDRGTFCHPRRRVVGEERPSKRKARKAADDAWMGAVRYDYGERFQDLNHAKDVRHNCDPSSTSSILKRVHFRCVVEATPCRAPTGATEEKLDRRYEEDDNEDDDDDDRRKK